MKLNRDWQTFNRRWNSSRFEMFLIWSVIAHIGLAWLITIPMLTAHQEKVRLDQEREQDLRAEEKKIEELQEQVKKEADREVQAMLKEEIAQEQLRPIFEELTKDFLNTELADLYWDDLLLEFDVDFEELIEFFESPEFEQVGAEQKIMALKEKAVERLQELATRKQWQGMKDDVQAKLDNAAKQMAEHIKNELAKTVAQPVGADFEKKIADEKQKAIAALQKAEQELQQLVEPAEKSGRDFKEAGQKFDDLDKQHAAAINGKDKQLTADVAKQAKDQRAALIATGAEIRKLPTKLKLASKTLEGVYPQAAEELKKAEASVDAAGKNQQEALKPAADGKFTDTAARVKMAAENTGKALEGIRKVQAAIKLQLANIHAEDLRRAAAQLAGNAAEQGKEKDAADAGKDDNRKAVVAKKIAAAETSAGAVADKARQLANDVAAAKKQMPHGKDDKQKNGDLEATAAKAGDKLKQGQDDLGKQAPKAAAEKFAAAGKDLGELQKAIHAAQEKLGLPGEDTAKALAARLHKLTEKELAGKVDSKLTQAVKDAIVPAIASKLLPKLDDKLKGDKGAEIKKEIVGNLGKTLQKHLVDDMKPGEVFAKTAAQNLPAPASDTKDSNNPQVQDAANKAQKGAETAIERGIASIVAGAVRQPGVAELGKLNNLGDEKQADLLRRLELLKQRLDAKQKEFLGQVDGTGLAAAHKRFQNRKASVGRGIGLRQDRKALERLVDIIKDRGHITGELFHLKGAEGDLAKIDDEFDLRPNLIAVPSVPEKTTDDKPAERKVKDPDFKTIRFTGIPFLADDAIKLDGDLSDWKDLPRIELEPVNRGPGPKIVASPAKQLGHVAFNSTGLLLAVDIVDTSGTVETKYWKRNDSAGRASWDGPFWQNDCVEIYLDTLNTKDPRRGEPNTHQFFVFPFPCDDDENGGYESYMAKGQSWAKVPHGKEVIRKGSKKTENGWTLEVLIPKSILRRGDFNPGRIIGFNVQIDSGTNLYYFWTCNEQLRTSEHPQTWGDVQFLGSDARIELLQAKKDEVTKTVMPGQPLRIRVTDPDMNLDPGRKDKVSVTLRTVSGDSETILLEETELKSGIFIGSAPTRLDIGVRVPGVVELLEGEVVNVEYIDQARAYGERNQPIRAAFAASSIGTKLEQ